MSRSTAAKNDAAKKEEVIVVEAESGTRRERSPGPAASPALAGDELKVMQTLASKGLLPQAIAAQYVAVSEIKPIVKHTSWIQTQHYFGYTENAIGDRSYIQCENCKRSYDELRRMADRAAGTSDIDFYHCPNKKENLGASNTRGSFYGTRQQ